MPVPLSSDSTGALALMRPCTARSPELDRLACEYALDEVLEVHRTAQPRHIPGVADAIANASPR
eukprot:14613953-Alexandrium_andersonii.AAC.1